MKRAVLVLGPESSGTRWLTRTLIDAGCVGDDGHVQRWDAELPTDEPLVVWRRSFPHGQQWPDAITMIRTLQARDYDVRVLVTARDWYCMEQSQHRFQEARDVRPNSQRAYLDIFTALRCTNAPFVVVSYEALLMQPELFGAWLLGWCGVSRGPISALDGNTKYYTEVGINATTA